MAWNGSGIFNRIYSWVSDKAGAIPITASRMDGEFNNFKTGLENCLTRDGQTLPTQNIPFNGKKITGLSSGSLAGDSIEYSQFNTAITGVNSSISTTNSNVSALSTSLATLTTQVGTIQGRNKIINGAMEIDQRNNGAAVPNQAGFSNLYTLDRWAYQATLGSKFTIQRNALGTSAPAGFYQYLTVTSGTAFTPGVGDYYVMHQIIEGCNIRDLAWGTASAKPIGLSFWAYASVAGTYSGSINNSSGTRSYPFSFALAAGTWTYVSMSIPGETSGSWNGSYGQSGATLRFDIGSGSNYRGTAGAWANANYNGASGSVALTGLTGAQFAITGVQLEANSVTPFEFRPYGYEFSLCLRYTWVLNGTDPVVGCQVGLGQAVSTVRAIIPLRFPVPMCKAPSAPTLSAVADFALSNATGAFTALSSVSAPTTITAYGIDLDVNVGSAVLAAGNAVIMRGQATSASRIPIVAELN